MKLKTIKLVIPLLFAGAAAWAQGRPGNDQQDPPTPPPQGDSGAPPQPGPGGGFHPNGPGRRGVAPMPPRAGRPPMERAMPHGRWWNNPEMVQKLSLTSDQQKKMDDIFQQNRLRLIDLNANTQREEVTMEPLMAADTPDEPKILAQIDKIAQARAELEKANARFLLGIRRILTQEQWKKLRAEMPLGQGFRGGPPNPPAPAHVGR
jgi:Spy/CpxP family protein refolding chaperone